MNTTPEYRDPNIFTRMNLFLDRYILPWPVRFLTFRFVIILTMALLIPLVIYANYTAFVLLVNSYLNVMSVAVSSIVLLYATISEARQKQIAELQEKRAQEDHTHVTEMHNLILNTLQYQLDELEELKKLVALAGGQEYTPAIPSPLPDLRDMHPRGDDRFEDDDASRRMKEQLHHNPLVSTLRRRLGPDK